MEKEHLEKNAALLFSSGVAVSFEDSLENFSLDKKEEEIISSSSSPKRIQDFKLGRKAAKAALKKLSLISDNLLLKGPSGEPVWPDGYTGSITHSSGWAGAVALKNENTKKETANKRAIGFDFQTIYQGAEDKSAALDRTLTALEKNYLKELPNKSDEIFYKLLIFSAKEAIYKALSTNLDFNKELNWQSINLVPEQLDKDKRISLSTEFQESFLVGAKEIKELKCCGYIHEGYILSGAEATLNNQQS